MPLATRREEEAVTLTGNRRVRKSPGRAAASVIQADCGFESMVKVRGRARRYADRSGQEVLCRSCRRRAGVCGEELTLEYRGDWADPAGAC